MIINQRIDTFLGLNNMLNPASAGYKEGMAYKSSNARIDEAGLWSAQQSLVGVSAAPSTTSSPIGGGNYFKSLNVNGDERIVIMAVDTSCDVGPNKQLYATDGSIFKNAGGKVQAFTPPSVPTVAEDQAGASRAEDGVYYYMCTFYDSTYDRESLPSPATSGELDQASTASTHIKVTPPSPSGSNTVRIYRSKRTWSIDGVYNPINIFYFLTEQDDGTAYDDYLHDSEVEYAEYEGRGTDPTTAIGDEPDYLISFNNRMLYFKDHWLYWSSAGRPQEVATEYTLTYDTSYTITCKPLLSIRNYGEAKYEIPEFRGHRVKGAFPLGNKLWVWSENMMGYIEPTTRYEGYKFRLMYEGIGVTSDKVLSLSPYGLFGADYQGIWLFTGNGRPKRLTDKRIDLRAGTGTTFSNTEFGDSFGCWCSALNEYWWGVSGKVIAYQAERDIFVGPYNYSINSGCQIPNGTITSGRALNYFTGGVAPDPTIKDSVAATLQFWLGQTTPTTIKEQVAVEVLHATTPGGSVTLDLYQNITTETTGATSPAQISYSSKVGKIKGVGSGRFFMLQIGLPSAGAPVATINYKYNPAGDTLG